MLNTLSLHPPHNKRTNDDTNSDVKMKKNTFKVLFLIRRNQVNKDGKCAIMIKVTVDGEYERINSTLTIEPELWDASASKAIGRSSKIAEFNKRIEDMRAQAESTVHMLNWAIRSVKFLGVEFD